MKRFIFVLACVIGLAATVHAQGVGHRHWIPATSFHAIHAEGTPNTHVAAAGTAVPTEISTFGLVGYAMTAADLVSTMFPWPAEYHNPLYAVGYRIWWVSDSAGATDGGVDWLLDVEEKALATEDPLETATVALADGIAFAADSSKVQYAISTTNWDTIGVEAHQTYHYDTMVEMSVELDDDGDLTGDEPHFLGVEIYFVPKDFRGDVYYIPASTVTSMGVDGGIKLTKRAGY